MCWTDCFQIARRQPKPPASSKTWPADIFVWTGRFEAIELRIVSTIRLIEPMQHFLNSSNARIFDARSGGPVFHGYYVDLQVDPPQSPAVLKRIGQLARTMEQRPVYVRSRGQLLAQAIRAD
jgi:hypothetical protein